MHYLHLTLLQAVSFALLHPVMFLICSYLALLWYVPQGFLPEKIECMFQYATCCLFTIFNQIFLFVPPHSNTTFFYDLCLHPFSLPTHSLFLFHFPSTLSPIYFSSQWQESPFSLCLVYPTAGCLAGRDVDSMAGQASSLDVGASSQWLWSAWTGISRFAISDMVRN